METSKLILGTVLGLFLFSEALAESIVTNDQQQVFAATGFVANTAMSGANKVNYPSIEAGIGSSYQINDNIGLHGSLNLRDDLVSIDTLYLEFDSRVGDSPITANAQLGKNRTYIGLNNYARFYPAARTFIIAPQGIYWASMDELVGNSTGAKLTIKHDNGLAFQISQSSVDIHQSLPINESTFIPGVISKAQILVYGLTYTARSAYVGLQHVTYNFKNGMEGIFKDPSLDMNLAFIKLHDYENELSLEWMNSSSSLNSLDGNSRWQDSYSITYSRVLTEDILASFNYNITSYNHDQELKEIPNKNTAIEKIKNGAVSGRIIIKISGSI